mmetsp:Transcript_59785/g.83038  ORF Transcript_59785/g.83038 Transcript_59785/m.83038 type:complete len:439 (+) Transcript_59785:2-1318(+)
MSAAHDFVKKHFNKPTWCAQCEKFIWGLVNQGYACKKCTFPCHPKCRTLVTEPCPGVKTNHHKRTLDDAHAKAPPSEAKASSRKKAPSDAATVVPEVDDTFEEEPAPKSQPRGPLTSQPSLQRIVGGKKEECGKVIEDVYEILEELGRGAFSVVKKARHKETGEIFAAKVISKKNVQQDLHRLAIEMEVLQTVHHPNIIELKEVFETEEMLYIVTELVTGGELFDRIVSKGSYSEHDAAALVRKFVEALDYLHDKGIVHRDLKPENLLLKNDDEDTDIKLADFGLSKIMGSEVMMQTACGTPGYVAPEILQAKGYGREVDMWSVGVITYILLCGFPPFYNENIPLLFESIMKADFDYPEEYWNDISDEAIAFIDGLLEPEPEKRMTAKQALADPWLQGNAPKKAISIGAKLGEYTNLYREQSRASAPTSCDDENPMGF